MKLKNNLKTTLHWASIQHLWFVEMVNGEITESQSNRADSSINLLKSISAITSFVLWNVWIKRAAHNRKLRTDSKSDFQKVALWIYYTSLPHIRSESSWFGKIYTNKFDFLVYYSQICNKFFFSKNLANKRSIDLLVDPFGSLWGINWHSFIHIPYTVYIYLHQN